MSIAIRKQITYHQERWRNRRMLSDKTERLQGIIHKVFWANTPRPCIVRIKNWFLTLHRMKIQFRAIGKNHDAHFKEAIQLFSKRINHYYPVEWKIVPPSKLSQKEDARSAETRVLIQRQQGDVLVALDAHGKQLNSVGLANFMEEQTINGAKNVIFSIGGAYGFDRGQLNKCDLIWSLSPLTFPHQLVRLILAEQVYRACTIIRREGYHHE